MGDRLPRPWRATDTGRPSRTYSLRPTESGFVLAGGRRELLAADLEEALFLFEAGVRFHVAERSPQRAFVHAGAVARDGRAIVLPGVPAAGKSTLTAALTRAGATYLSDEYAPIDGRGRVHPFPKPLSIARPPHPRPLQQPVEAFGGVQGTEPCPVGLVVFTSYAGPKRHWRPRTLTPGEAVLELLRHATSAERHPEQTFRRLESVVLAAPALQGARGEADETATLILAQLESARPGRGRN